MATPYTSFIDCPGMVIVILHVSRNSVFPIYNFFVTGHYILKPMSREQLQLMRGHYI